MLIFIILRNLDIQMLINNMRVKGEKMGPKEIIKDIYLVGDSDITDSWEIWCS